MFRKIRKYYTLVFYLLLLSKAFGQSNIKLNSFTGNAEATQVQLRWVIGSGQTCNGTFIERSVNAFQWERIGEIPGVCGNSTTPVPYNFIDEFPLLNTINYYRLELGGQGYSTVISVPFYNFSEKGYVLIPNPAWHKAKFYFGNSESEKFKIYIYSVSGILVHKHEGVGSTYEFDVTKNMPGIYVFIISRQGLQDVTGKLIIQ